MTDSTYQLLGLAFITMIGTSIASTVAGVLAYFKSKDAMKESVKATDQSKINTIAIGEVDKKQDVQHRANNSRIDELIESIKKTAHAEGMAQGIKNEQDRVEAILSKPRLILADETALAKKELAKETTLAKEVLAKETALAKEVLAKHIEEARIKLIDNVKNDK